MMTRWADGMGEPPPIRAIPLGPIDSPPYEAIPTLLGESPAPANEAALREALAPLKLGSYDERVLANLVLEASTTVAVVCSLLARKEAAARADERRQVAEEIRSLIRWEMDGGFRNLFDFRDRHDRLQHVHVTELSMALEALADEIEGDARDSH